MVFFDLYLRGCSLSLGYCLVMIRWWLQLLVRTVLLSIRLTIYQHPVFDNKRQHGLALRLVLGGLGFVLVGSGWIVLVIPSILHGGWAFYTLRHDSY